MTDVMAPDAVSLDDDEDDDEPFSEQGMRNLTTCQLAIAGHIKTLGYLLDELKAARDKETELARQHEILEFVTLEITDAATKAEDIARGWGNCFRRAQKARRNAGDALATDRPGSIEPEANYFPQLPRLPGHSEKHEKYRRASIAPTPYEP
jgi:hypothetical protein